MTSIKNFLSSPENRKYLYRVVQALAPILIAAGILLPGTETLLLTLAGAILGISSNELAARNINEHEQTLEPEGLGE